MCSDLCLVKRGLFLCPSGMPEHVHCTRRVCFDRVEVVFVYSTLGWVFVRGATVHVCVLYWGLSLGYGCVLALWSLTREVFAGTLDLCTVLWEVFVHGS